ncbi:hypothetical protein [Paenibacillus sp. O199]|uniref:hypothetical protein n=1 Tax=Paenibacillus sp. O199 TaxID=1643925 RepID=UPI0007BF5907|nr:hypothetical protein [Paenibacillus sp. O199]
MYKVIIKYKKKSQFQRDHLVNIIGMVPPAYRAGVTVNAMSDSMLKGGTFTITFEKQDYADKLASNIFESYGNYIDITKEYE